MTEDKDEENNENEDDIGVKVKENDSEGNAIGDDDDFAPTTVVIMLGSMNFEPVDSVDILSLKIANPDEMDEVLEKSCRNIRPNSLESVHVLLKSSSVSSLFDESILSYFFDGIIPGKEVTVHVLPESAMLAEDMPVHSGDVESIRMGLVMAGLLLKVEQEHEGSWVLTAIKPGGVEDGEVEPKETEEQEGEEKEFLNLVSEELETNS